MASRPRRKSSKRTPRNDGRLPRNAPPITVTITHIGGRGDGVGTIQYAHNYNEAEYSVFIPASLPGETVIAQPLSISNQGIKARILELHSTVPTRQTPQCNAFPACGGCSFQHWSEDEIANWKTTLITSHLERTTIAAGTIRPVQTSPLHSRRRASFHIKRLADSAVVGFRERMGEHIVDPDGCVVIAPALARLKTVLSDFATQHLPIGSNLDAQVNLLTPEDDTTSPALCVYLHNTTTHALWTPDLQTALCTWAAEQRLARLSIDDHGSPLTLYAPQPPRVTFGSLAVTPPPGAFLQATHAGEHALQAAVAEIIGDHTHIADLFAGCGTLSLPLLGNLAGLIAVEGDANALASLKTAVDTAGLGGRLRTEQRNLFDAPLLPAEFDKITAVILDPPRSGAAAQCQQLAQSDVTSIAMVSCNPASFARDAALLVAGGFQLEWVQPIDQFTFSNHLELVGAFRR